MIRRHYRHSGTFSSFRESMYVEQSQRKEGRNEREASSEKMTRLQEDQENHILISQEKIDDEKKMKETHKKIAEWFEQNCESQCDGCHRFTIMMKGCLQILEKLHSLKINEGFTYEKIWQVSRRVDQFKENILSNLILHHIPSLIKKITQELKESKFQNEQLWQRREIMIRNYDFEIEYVKNETKVKTEGEFMNEAEKIVKYYQKNIEIKEKEIEKLGRESKMKEKVLMERIKSLNAELEKERIQRMMRELQDSV